MGVLGGPLWALGQALGDLGGPWGVPGARWVDRGAVSGSFGGPWGALGAHLGVPGGPWGILGVSFGAPGGPLGVDGGPLETTLGKQAALQNHWFYYINGYILALERGLGGTWGGEVEAKTGVEELRGDRGAHKKTKTKRARADEEKKGPKGPPKAFRSLTLALPWAEVYVLP